MTAKNSENTYFYIHDHLGSTSLVLDVDGNISQSVTYIPYGEIFVEERNGTWNSLPEGEKRETSCVCILET